MRKKRVSETGQRERERKRKDKKERETRSEGGKREGGMQGGPTPRRGRILKKMCRSLVC